MRLFKRAGTIAIDGPAGSGKSTVSRLLAERLGYMYIDTGAMYRALTLKVIRQNVDFNDEEKIVKLSEDLELNLLPSDGKMMTIRVILDGEDVSEAVRDAEVTRSVKYIARLGKVRKNLVKLQRKMAGTVNNSVMEGRDIGTVVLPNAKYKIYLDASFEERITRRFTELRAKGRQVTREKAGEDLKKRDHADKTRKEGPLKKADDAVLMDTTDLSVDQVVSKIIDYVRSEKE